VQLRCLRCLRSGLSATARIIAHVPETWRRGADYGRRVVTRRWYLSARGPAIPLEMERRLLATTRA
jgi:hypothetical protein